MILTEEQRAAIHAVSGLLTAIGCPQCHSYLQKNYTHHIEVLRAMTDSSEQFSDASKMIGFDLERARGLRDFLQDDCAEVGDVWAEMIAEIERLQVALLKSDNSNKIRRGITEGQDGLIVELDDKIRRQDTRIKELEGEIERLREALDESEQILAHKTKTATHWYEEGLKTRADLVQSKRVVEQQAARLKELESSLDEAEALTKKNADLMNAYLARIAELEDALVEGLTNFLHYRASCYDPARRCPYAKECDDCSTWDACGHVEKFRSEARQLLQAEGKIGPDDSKKISHLRPYEVVAADLAGMLAKSWQITEERKAAIQRAEEMAGDCKAGDVLRDMLAEVTR